MKHFEEFLATNDIRKVSPDIGLAKALQKNAQERVEFALQARLSEKIAVFVYESIYEALREHADALLALEGYKSYSHVASIAFLQKYEDFSRADLNRLDIAREKRNRAKYYANPITAAETNELIQMYKQMKPQFDKLFESVIKK